MKKTDKKVFKLNIKDYEKLENLLHSWWVSLPDEMQQEIREFYDNPKTFEVK
jgi:tRNA A37 threonylcarbamoyladenosine synthetase subunit TsaC/SUA5/YrdC